METGRAVGYLVLKDGKKHYFDIVIPVDEEPTEDSSKFLSSGTIYEELEEIKESLREKDRIRKEEDGGNTAQVSVSADGHDLYIHFGIRDEEDEVEPYRGAKLTHENMPNFARVLSDPDKEEVTELVLGSGTIDVTQLVSGHIYSCTPMGAGLAVKNYFSNVDQFTNDKGEDVNMYFVFRYIKAPFTNSLGVTNYTHIVDIISAWGGTPEPV